MAFADGFVVPRLLRMGDAHRTLSSPRRRDIEEEETAPALMPLADQAMAGLVRLLEADLGIVVRFVAEPDMDPAQSKPAGAGIGAPVRLADGHIMGMLCFFHPQPDGQLDERDVRRLDMAARLAARLIDGADAHGIPS
ncbi:GAF domain-containing protein [Variovorax sp. OV329]|uniref:GAF domain-containing protein n=1 Tax=Variovorax sp. OV329 TaxID=1882825 RepID=UPI0008DFAA55|nr:GAF domain-containing protein [Variovorax sp. OV329]SFN48768.1 hypothetical protein SAMN05444747_1306 [Variovorax sp. OV329]